MPIASTKNDGLTVNSVMLCLNSISDPGVDRKMLTMMRMMLLHERMNSFVEASCAVTNDEGQCLTNRSDIDIDS